MKELPIVNIESVESILTSLDVRQNHFISFIRFCQHQETQGFSFGCPYNDHKLGMFIPSMKKKGSDGKIRKVWRLYYTEALLFKVSGEGLHSRKTLIAKVVYEHFKIPIKKVSENG